MKFHRVSPDPAENQFTGLDLMSPVNYQRIHDASLRVLEDTGVIVEDEQTLDIFSGSGCVVDPGKKVVKIPRMITEDAIQSAPGRILLHGRGAEDDILLDSQSHQGHYANFPSNINVVEMGTGRVRPSTKQDLIQMTRLCDGLANLSFYSRAVYPLDVKPSLMHIHTAEACLKNTSMHSIHGPESEWETEQIIRMAETLEEDEANMGLRKPVSFVSSVISPLKMSRDFCEVVITSSRHGYTTIIASAAMAGGTAPIHLAGLIVQTNAEILSGIVLAQLVNRGTPVVYACYSTGMDLKLASSPLGSPEAALTTSIVSGLCKYYRIPCQVPGLATDSKKSGSQAAFEKTLTGFSTAMSGADLILGAGGLETGLTFDPALAVMDNEMIGMMMHFKQGISVSPETLATDLIHEVGHAGNFIYHPSTFSQMKSTSQPDIFNRQNRVNWENSGSPESYDEAGEISAHIINHHKPARLSNPVEKKINDILSEAENLKRAD